MSCSNATGWCRQVKPHHPYTADQCQRCWLMTHSADHRRNWGVDGPALSVTAARLVRQAAPATKPCAPCKKGTPQRVERPAKSSKPWRAPQATAPAGYAYHGMPVNRWSLAYHLLPVAGRWERHVERLKQSWPLFTGKKVFSVATGGTVKEQDTGRTLRLSTAAEVRAALPSDAQVIEVENDPSRWELVSWSQLWQRVLDGADPLDAVLYAHAKGVTRPEDSPAHRWADMLYSLCLDSNKPIDEAFRKYPVVGPLMKPGHFFRGRPFDKAMADSAWHYSGNFWWARAGDIGQRLKRVPVPIDRWGTEAWVGIAYRQEEAGNLWSPTGDFHLYAPEQMDWAEAELLARPRPGVSPVYPRLSIVIGTKGRGTLPRTVESLVPQLRPGDEVIIERDESDDWGATPRTRGQRTATGDYLLWFDDDDVYVEGALERVRGAIKANPGRVLLFQMYRSKPHEDLLPKERAVRIGQVSTQMFVVPNDPGKLGVWGSRSGGDFDFLASTLRHYPEGPVWVPEVLAVWRPEAAAVRG